MSESDLNPHNLNTDDERIYECEECELIFDEEEGGRYEPESGVALCETCWDKEMAYWSRQCRGTAPITAAQLRDDLTYFRPGDDEWIKLTTQLNSMAR